MQTEQADLPRGIRDNNPGNIKHSLVNHWQGELLPPDGEYCKFDTAHNGLRAFAKNLWSYYNKDNCKTLRQIIERHAPSNENDTEAYIDDVSYHFGSRIDDVFEMNIPFDVNYLMQAMIRHENGMLPYSYDDIELAIMDTGHWQ